MTIEPSLIVWTVLCFLALMLILKKLLFQPMLTFMDTRNAKIEAARKAKEDARTEYEAEARRLADERAAQEAQLRQSDAEALEQAQEELRRDYLTGVYNARYLDTEYRRYAEPQAQAGKPVGVVMARVNEYWSLRQNESANAADCCLNMAAGILQLSVGTDDRAAVLARLEDGLFAVVTVGTPAAQVARKLQDALDTSRREFSISLSRRGSFTVQLASAEWGETPAWDMMFSLAQQRL